MGPNDYQVVATTDPTVATLTLTSCHPRYTARDRIVITSELDPTQSDPVGESVLNYGRPLEPATETPPIRLDDPTVSAPVDTAPATTAEPATTDPAAEVEAPIAPTAVERRHRRCVRRGVVQRPECERPGGPVGCRS